MPMFPPILPTVEEMSASLIEEWKRVSLKVLKYERETRGKMLAEANPSEEMRAWLAEGDKGSLALIEKQAEEIAQHIHCLWRDNSDKSAAELEDMAANLSHGSIHNTSGLIARLVLRDYLAYADYRTLAALIWWNWHGGKVGFQFLPDPVTTWIDDYREEAWGLLELFDSATEGDPSRILTGDDLEFYQSLPDRLTIWRGCAGVSAEVAGEGLCWTTRRDIAVWFACRGAYGERKPILVRARVHKSEIRLAKACEFEVVTVPRRCHAVRHSKWDVMDRPADMTWSPAHGDGQHMLHL
jgi:hypothetical protein